MSRQGFIKRLCEEERQLCDVRNAAAEFFRVNGVPQQLERALNELLSHEPDDLHGYLANYFTNLSMPPRISRLKGRKVYDAAGQLTVETEVFCIVCNKEKSMSSAAVSGHFGPKETLLDWKAESQERADHVMTAIQWINEPLNNMLNDQNPCDQSQIDHRLSNFFMERYVEEKDIWSKEENCSLSNPEVVLSPPLLAPTKDKKTVEKGKKSNTTEKIFPPAEPPEKVLPGSLAIGSISLAVAKTGAQIQGVPLYKYISALGTRKAPTQFHIPVVLVTLLSCGKNSPGKLSLLEEIILIPKAGQGVKQIITMILELQKEMMRIINTSTKAGFTQAMCDSGAPAVSYERPEQPLDLITEACTNVGLALGTDIHIALNCAAPVLMDFSKGKYEVATGVLKSPDELVEMYQNLISRYPAVVALIDPFRREDTDQWEKLTNVIGDSCSLISDITYKSKAPALPGVRGHISKHKNEITVSDLIHITSEHRGSVLMGVTCNEPCSDYSLPDIAVGLGLDYVKLGGLRGAERMTKYNRLISIEEELAQQGILVSKEKHGPPLFTEKPQESITDESSLP